jgi:hypothetical protein
MGGSLTNEELVSARAIKKIIFLSKQALTTQQRQ